MEKVSSLMNAVLRRRGLADHAQGALAVLRAQAWLVGRLPPFASFIQVQAVRDGEVLIACTHGAAMQECRALEQELLQELRKDPACGIIRSVRVMRQ